MIVEISRLLMALAVMCFHKQVGDFILQQEQRLAARLSQRGIFVPEFPSREFAHNLYFFIGVIVSVATVLQLWMAL
jgi:hypothetical protein